MMIISPGTPVQRRVSLTMVTINILAFSIVGPWAICLNSLYRDALIRDLGHVPAVFETLFATWIPSVSHTYAAIADHGDPLFASIVLTIQSFTWLVFLCSLCALIATFLNYWRNIIPKLDTDAIKAAIDQRDRFGRRSSGLPYVKMTIGIILSVGLLGTSFFGVPGSTAAQLMAADFSLFTMPVTMMFTLLLLSGTSTLIFNLAVNKKLSRGGPTAQGEAQAPVPAQPAFAA